MPLLLTLNIFHTFFIVFIVDFKQGYVCWVLTTSFLLNLYADISRFMWLKWYVDFDIWEVLPIFKPFEHLQHIQQAIIYSVSTQHDIFSSDFHLISAEVSKNNTFIIGFTVNNIKWQSYSYCQFPAGIYLLKVNNRNTRAKCKIYSK